jgi:hypothetical protein
MKIIEMLKEMLGVTDTIVSNDESNFDDHYGRLLLTPNNENWSRINANQKKKKVDRLREYPSTSLCIANRFEFYVTPKTKLRKLNQLQSYLIIQIQMQKIVWLKRLFHLRRTK